MSNTEYIILEKSLLDHHNNVISAKVGTSVNRTIPEMDTVVAAITTGIEPQKHTYSQVNSYVADYLANANYSPSDYTTSVIENYCGAVPGVRKDRPLGQSVSVSAGTLVVSDKIGNATSEKNVSAGSVTIENVIPATNAGEYAVSKDGEISECGTLTPTGAVRMINGGGNTFNIRDIGGWACDGGTLKYGLVFRGGELNGDNYDVSLNADQVAFFRDYLGIKDEIDLRGNSEVDGDDEIYGTADDITSSALGDSVDYARFPIAAYANGVNIAAETQSAYYRDIIKRIAYDLTVNRPVYIHCMAGADRTGTVCALIEAICGVAQTDIDKDYEITSFATGNTRKRNGESWTGLITRINSFSGSSFRDKVVNYALQTGVTIAEINAIRRGLINGNPTDLTSPFATASVSRSLTDVSSSNTDNTTPLYQPYETELTPTAGFTLTNASVAMGGTDISANVIQLLVNGGVDIAANNHKARIYIPRVTGNIALLAGASAGARLPSAYQEVEWIASNGNETIQVEFPNDSSKIGSYIHYSGLMRTDSGVRGLMGGASTGSATIGAAAGTYFGWSTSGYWDMGGTSISTTIQSSTTEFDDVKFEWYAAMSGRLYRYVNGAWSEVVSRAGSTGAYTKWNVFGGTGYKVSCKSKEIEVYAVAGGSTRTAYLIPCYRKSDNEVSMFDLEAGEFCTKIGSGSFTKGADV